MQWIPARPTITILIGIILTRMATVHKKQEMDIGNIDVVQVDLTRCGGFTEAMKIAALAWDRGLPVANHGFTTYVNVTAALHWLNSIPNTLICEFVAEEETNLREAITRQKLRAKDGYLDIPQEPGLGIELDEAALEKFGS